MFVCGQFSSLYAKIVFMKFIILGSGTSVPHPKRSSAGFWLETENGSLLLDCSASAVLRMAQEKLDWANLDAIWISHFHLDHVGGIAPFLFGIKHAPETQSRRKTLKIFGAKGLKKLIKSFDEAGDYELLKQTFPLEIIEVEPLEKFEILPETEAVAVKTPHTDESLAIHIRDKNDKTLVYTADTGFTKDLGTLARNVDLFDFGVFIFQGKSGQNASRSQRSDVFNSLCRTEKSDFDASLPGMGRG